METTRAEPRVCERCGSADGVRCDDLNIVCLCAACREAYLDETSLIVRGGLAILQDQVDAILAADRADAAHE